ncbi:hypothetical protein Mapa_007345 [Marchantia paleacea]|nr:hypothetical protein Mapa_007345 [Marchantia paleacea]
MIVVEVVEETALARRCSTLVRFSNLARTLKSGWVPDPGHEEFGVLRSVDIEASASRVVDQQLTRVAGISPSSISTLASARSLQGSPCVALVVGIAVRIRGHPCEDVGDSDDHSIDADIAIGRDEALLEATARGIRPAAEFRALLAGVSDPAVGDHLRVGGIGREGVVVRAADIHAESFHEDIVGREDEVDGLRVGPEGRHGVHDERLNIGLVQVLAHGVLVDDLSCGDDVSSHRSVVQVHVPTSDLPPLLHGGMARWRLRLGVPERSEERVECGLLLRREISVVYHEKLDHVVPTSHHGPEMVVQNQSRLIH